MTQIVKTITPDTYPFQYRCTTEGCSWAKPILAEDVNLATGGAEAHVRTSGHTVVVESRATEEAVSAPA